MTRWWSRFWAWLLSKLCGDAPSWVDKADEERHKENYRVPFHITDEDRSQENLEKVRKLHGV